MARKNPRRNITRVVIRGEDGEAYGGWQVRVQRKGRRFGGYFADRQLGGNRAALHAAKSFRDHIERSHTGYTLRQRARAATGRNTSGTVGVHLEVRPQGRSDSRRSWRAQWTDRRGRRRTRSFSVEKYGERRARELAVRSRRAAIR